MYQQRMMLPPWAHHGYDGDSAAAGDAAPRAIAVPNMASVRVAWTKCLSDMTRPSLLNDLRQHAAGASTGYEMRIGRWQLKFLLKRRSVTQVTLAGFGSAWWSLSPQPLPMEERDVIRSFALLLAPALALALAQPAL